MVTEKIEATDTTRWQAQYRSRYARNWAPTSHPFSSKAEALAWFERERHEPIRVPTELRIVEAHTVVTVTEVAACTMPTK
jgi:hypothetical protein